MDNFIDALHMDIKKGIVNTTVNITDVEGFFRKFVDDLPLEIKKLLNRDDRSESEGKEPENDTIDNVSLVEEITSPIGRIDFVQHSEITEIVFEDTEKKTSQNLTSSPKDQTSPETIKSDETETRKLIPDWATILSAFGVSLMLMVFLQMVIFIINKSIRGNKPSYQIQAFSLESRKDTNPKELKPNPLSPLQKLLFSSVYLGSQPILNCDH